MWMKTSTYIIIVYGTLRVGKYSILRILEYQYYWSISISSRREQYRDSIENSIWAPYLWRNTPKYSEIHLDTAVFDIDTENTQVLMLDTGIPVSRSKYCSICPPCVQYFKYLQYLTVFCSLPGHGLILQYLILKILSIDTGYWNTRISLEILQYFPTLVASRKVKKCSDLN